MSRWWDSVRTRLHIPSWSAIINFIIVQVALQLIWAWISSGFTYSLIRELGSLAIFIAVIFAVAWYLPKLTAVIMGKPSTTANGPSTVSASPQIEDWQIQNPTRRATVLTHLDEIIKQGEALAAQMGDRGFDFRQLSQPVQAWLDTGTKAIWDEIPKAGPRIAAEKGDLTGEEQIRYTGWKWDEIGLRVPVDRKIKLLREIRAGL